MRTRLGTTGAGGRPAPVAVLLLGLLLLALLLVGVAAGLGVLGGADRGDSPGPPPRPGATAPDPTADPTDGPTPTSLPSSATGEALSPFTTAENAGLSRCTPGADVLADCGPAPRLRATGPWLGTPGGRPLALADLRGRVVLLDFLAYSCTSCRRDAPLVQRWADAYRDAGLTVVGVHAPELDFERSADNLRAAVARLGIDHPVVQDADLATWRAYRNRYLPTKFLLDARGTVRALTFGEGGYDRTESLLRALLTERDPDVALPAPVTDRSTSTAVVPARDRTPALRLSAFGGEGYAGTPARLGQRVRAFTLNPDQPRGTYSLGGRWTLGTAYASPAPGARLRLHYRAAAVYQVLAGTGTVTVSQEGRPDRVVRVSGTPDARTLLAGDEATSGVLTLTYAGSLRVYTVTYG